MAFVPVTRGKSCIIADQSGSGKTLAYLAPVMQRLRQEELQGLAKSSSRSPRVVILVPTAELASQASKYLAIWWFDTLHLLLRVLFFWVRGWREIWLDGIVYLIGYSLLSCPHALQSFTFLFSTWLTRSLMVGTSGEARIYLCSVVSVEHFIFNESLLYCYI